MSLHGQLQTLLGRNFRFTDQAGVTNEARLVAVEDGPWCQGLDQFSVVFEGKHLSDGMNDVFHPEIGDMPISLSCSECADASRTRKRAHFSLLISHDSERLA